VGTAAFHVPIAQPDSVRGSRTSQTPCVGRDVDPGARLKLL